MGPPGALAHRTAGAQPHDPASVRANYLTHVEELNELYHDGLSDVGIDYHLINTRQPFHDALSIFLDTRRKGSRR